MMRPFVFFILFGSVFAFGIFTDAYILPKWLFAILALSLFAPVFIFNGTNAINRRFVSTIFSVVALLLCAMCFFAQIMCIWDTQNSPIATYDNVAGVIACLCPLLVYIIYGTGERFDAMKKVSVSLILFCILSLKSRTGILASFLPLILYIFFNRGSIERVNSKTKWYTFFCLVMTLFFITLGIGKIDSTKGRLLVWEVTLQMLSDALPFGFGCGGFERNYMNYQAEYFRHHTESAYALLADNTTTPFNEYLHLIINYGLIGFVIFVTLIVLYSNWYKRCKSDKRYVSLCSILSIGILSMFSYPFLYPVTWIMLALNFLCIMPQNYWYNLNLYGRNIAFCTTPIAICIASYVVKCGIDERMWREYSEMDNIERKKNMVMKKKLDASFRDNQYYNYAEALEKYETKDYERTLYHLSVCEKHMADYDVLLLKVQSLLHLKKYKEVKQYAEQAHYMCPCRFYPLYYLALAYYAENNIKMMRQVCEEIRNKKIKVNSWDIMAIRYLSKKIYTGEKMFSVESLIDI